MSTLFILQEEKVDGGKRKRENEVGEEYNAPKYEYIVCTTFIDMYNN